MKLEQLRQIVVIEKCKSISKAAKELYMRQPALSTSLNSLEKSLGVQIFQRSPQGVTPTEDGKRILETIHRILNDTDSLIQYSSQNDPENLTGSIKVSISPIYSHLFFDIITRYKEKFPKVDFQIAIYPFVRIKELFQHGEYNIAIDYAPQKTLEDEKFSCYKLKTHKIRFFAGPLSRFYDREEVHLEELREERFLAYSKSYWKEINKGLKIRTMPIFAGDTGSITHILRNSDVIGALADIYEKLDAGNDDGRPRMLPVREVEDYSFDGFLIYPGNRQLSLLEKLSVRFLKELLMELE